MTQRNQVASEIFKEIIENQQNRNQVFFYMSRILSEAIETNLADKASVEEVIGIMENNEKLIELAKRTKCKTLQSFVEHGEEHLMKCLVEPIVMLRANLEALSNKETL